MKRLIKKELTLNWKWYNYLLFLFPVLLLVPNYPLFNGMIYVFLFATTLFPSFAVNGDYQFLSSLPVRRKDIVASKFFDILFGQLGTLIIAIPVLAVKAFLLDGEGNTLMDPNTAFVGMILFDYAVFVLAFFPAYFTELKFPKAFLIALLLFMVSAALLELLVQFITPLRVALDSLDRKYLPYRLLVLFIGLISYIGSIILSFRLACKRFSRYTM